ncbi:MAG: type II toxin-antitoxin system RelE/ParE family toxin [Candidatus Omnitrophica bacterium]|nr:type II toxin-antitoxin system RelE/ParE family toxin [Candidatus Omnitrophota bacterium]
MSRKRAIYYPDARGKIPALSFLRGLPQDEQQKAYAYISYLEEQGEALRRPIAEYLGGKLYELRPKQVRILYAFVGRQDVVILHAFRKKTGSVPTSEQRLAQARLADFVRRQGQGMIAITR